MVTKGGLFITVQNWKNVLYIPSVSLFRVAPLWLNNPEVDIWRINAFKSVGIQVKNDLILEYLRHVKYENNQVTLDYNFSRAHPLFNYNEFLEVLPQLPVNDFVVEELCLSIPLVVNLEPDTTQGNRLVLVFRNELGVKMDRSGGAGSSDFIRYLQENNRRWRCLEHPHTIEIGNEDDLNPSCSVCGNLMTFENLCSLDDSSGFKNSCLDLKGMIRSKKWASSYGRNYVQYDVNETDETGLLNTLRNFLDPQRELLRKRTYQKGKRDEWILTSADTD